MGNFQCMGMQVCRYAGTLNYDYRSTTCNKQQAAMAKTSLTGAVQIVKYALMTEHEFLNTGLKREVYERMKAQFGCAKHGDRMHKALIIHAHMANSADMRSRAARLLDSKF